jgi:hypothetical protein
MRTVFITILGLALTGCGQKATVVPRPVAGASQEPGVAEFTAKLNEFKQVRDSVEKQLKPLPDQSTPEVLTARRDELMAGVRKARTGAREGDLFTPPVRTYLARIIATELSGADGKPARDVAKQGNPKFDEPAGPAKVTVNARYPEAQPASTMPPTLLLRLPQLPEDLQYRFVGTDLILLDSKTGLVLDIFRRAAPHLAATKR